MNVVNIELNERMHVNSKSLSDNSAAHSVTETNLKLEEAFYGEKPRQNSVPTYVTTETAAIKITGGEE